jgi:hypothetical protein
MKTTKGRLVHVVGRNRDERRRRILLGLVLCVGAVGRGVAAPDRDNERDNRGKQQGRDLTFHVKLLDQMF